MEHIVLSYAKICPNEDCTVSKVDKRLEDSSHVTRFGNSRPELERAYLLRTPLTSNVLHSGREHPIIAHQFF